MKLKLTLVFVVFIPTFVMAQAMVTDKPVIAPPVPLERPATATLPPKVSEPNFGNNINENHLSRSVANPMPAQQAQEGKREGVSNRWFPDEVDRVEGVLPGRFPNGVN